ncbi:Beta-galactosidase precursor [compost metagenome]
MYKMPLEKQEVVASIKAKEVKSQPVVLKGTFNLTETGDTFLDMEAWGKGIVFVNGYHLGRYWNVGPQQTLYLPGCWLKKGANEITIVEFNKVPSATVKGVKTPVLDKLKSAD